MKLKLADPLQFWASIVSLTAVYLISERIFFEGWAINAFGDCLWAWWGIRRKAIWLIILQVVFFFIAINGIMNA